MSVEPQSEIIATVGQLQKFLESLPPNTPLALPLVLKICVGRKIPDELLSDEKFASPAIIRRQRYRPGSTTQWQMNAVTEKKKSADVLKT